MNYSTIALALLGAYLWYAGSLMGELHVIKQMLVTIYETIEYKMSASTNCMRNETTRFMNRLQENTVYTIELVLNNSRKIDDINRKIIAIVDRD